MPRARTRTRRITLADLDDVVERNNRANMNQIHQMASPEGDHVLSAPVRAVSGNPYDPFYEEDRSFIEQADAIVRSGRQIGRSSTIASQVREAATREMMEAENAEMMRGFSSAASQLASLEGVSGLPADAQQFIQAASEFARGVLREEGFLRRILPPISIVDDIEAMKAQKRRDYVEKNRQENQERIVTHDFCHCERRGTDAPCLCHVAGRRRRISVD